MSGKKLFATFISFTLMFAFATAAVAEDFKIAISWRYVTFEKIVLSFGGD